MRHVHSRDGEGGEEGGGAEGRGSLARHITANRDGCRSIVPAPPILFGTLFSRESVARISLRISRSTLFPSLKPFARQPRWRINYHQNEAASSRLSPSFFFYRGTALNVASTRGDFPGWMPESVASPSSSSESRGPITRGAMARQGTLTAPREVPLLTIART